MAQAIICGTGALPALVAAELDDPFICTLTGNMPDRLDPDLVFRIEHVGTVLETLKSRSVTEVCFCGGVSRPQIDIAAIDAATLPLVPVLQQALKPGDDQALRALMVVLEKQGFTIKGAHEIAPALLPPTGCATQIKPSSGLETETALARDALKDMASIDEGQACVIRGSELVARENTRGTDAMLADLAKPRRAGTSAAGDPFSWVMDSVGEVLDDAADWLSGDAAEKARLKGSGALLFKGPKPGQDRRADLPAIGPETVKGAARAGLRGIVIEAGGVMVLHRSRVISMCDQAGLFLDVRPF